MSRGQPYVAVVDGKGEGLGFVGPNTARRLLKSRKARMVSRTPCVVRLVCKHAVETRKRHFAREQPAVIGADLGYETTAFVVRIGEHVVLAIEVEHRSKTITVRMTKRSTYRKGRRSRRARRPARTRHAAEGGALRQPRTRRRLAAAVAETPRRGRPQVARMARRRSRRARTRCHRDRRLRPPTS